MLPLWIRFVVLFCVFLVLTKTTVSETICGSCECPSYDVLETTSQIEVRRYPSNLWISWKEQGPMTSFPDLPFLITYSNELISKYFTGENYGNRNLIRTTPLKVELDIYQLEKPRKVSYSISVKDQENVPAPVAPLFIERLPERYVYVKQIPCNSTDTQIRHTVSEFMIDLALSRFPFNKNDVSFLLFDHPVDEDVRMNEIWIGRTLSRSSYSSKQSYSRTAGGFTSPSRAMTDLYSSPSRSSGRSSPSVYTTYSHGGVIGRKGLLNSLGDQPLHPIVVLQ